MAPTTTNDDGIEVTPAVVGSEEGSGGVTTTQIQVDDGDVEGGDVTSPTAEEGPAGANAAGGTTGDGGSSSATPRRASRRVSKANIEAEAIRRMSYRISINSAQGSADGAANNANIARRRMTQRMSVTANAAPFDVSYHPGIAKFFSAPHQRQRWGDSQILPRYVA